MSALVSVFILYSDISAQIWKRKSLFQNI